MKVYIFGHRRSGNHFVMTSLEENFKIEEAIKSHKFFEAKFLKLDGPKTLIVRDGRDILTACYHWWRGVKGSRVQLRYKTFSQFIRGEIPPIEGFKQSRYVVAPIDVWVSYMEGWVGKTPIIRFEDLKTDPITTLERVESELGLVRRNPEFQPVTRLVGYSPRKGIIGDWKNHFKDKDKDLFWSKAEHIMNKLGYKR